MDTLYALIDQLGYAAFFFALCLGLIGLPIPNEVVVMTGGAVAASGLLAPVPAFAAVFLGIASGLTFGYAVGRGAGGAIARRFAENKNVQKFLASSELLSRRYGSFAISLSIFLPLLRHITMYAVGLNRLAYWRFAAYAYPTAFAWTLAYFLIGTYVGKVVREGVWLKTGGDKKIVIKAKAASKKFKLKGKDFWVLKFSNKPCGDKPDVPIDTGARMVM